jgi:hypothetical protein
VAIVISLICRSMSFNRLTMPRALDRRNDFDRPPILDLRFRASLEVNVRGSAKTGARDYGLIWPESVLETLKSGHQRRHIRRKRRMLLKRGKIPYISKDWVVEPDGIEPTTSSMPLKRSPN